MASRQIAPATTYVVCSHNFYGKNHFVPSRTRKICLNHGSAPKKMDAPRWFWFKFSLLWTSDALGCSRRLVDRLVPYIRERKRSHCFCPFSIFHCHENFLKTVEKIIFSTSWLVGSYKRLQSLLLCTTWQYSSNVTETVLNLERKVLFEDSKHYYNHITQCITLYIF